MPSEELIREAFQPTNTESPAPVQPTTPPIATSVSEGKEREYDVPVPSPIPPTPTAKVEADDFELVAPPAQPSTLDIGLGEITNDLSSRVRINGRLGVLIAETPTHGGGAIYTIQIDGEAKPRKFQSPPAILEFIGEW